MKTMTQQIVVFAYCLMSCAALAQQQSVGVLGAYQDAKDGDAGYGGLLRYQYDVDPEAGSLRFFAQAGYLTGFGDDYQESSVEEGVSFTIRDEIEVDVMPLEIALLYDWPVADSTELYGGAGVGYYLTDSDIDLRVESMGVGLDLSSWASFDTDDELGFFGLIGVEQVVVDQVTLFAELRYSYLEVRTRTTLRIPDDPVESWSEDADLVGVGANIGVAVAW